MKEYFDNNIFCLLILCIKRQKCNYMNLDRTLKEIDERDLVTNKNF